MTAQEFDEIRAQVARENRFADALDREAARVEHHEHPTTRDELEWSPLS